MGKTESAGNAAPVESVRFATADIFDANPALVAVVEAPLLHFGGRRRFSGRCATLRATENPQTIAEAVQEPGRGRVLVIDGRAVSDCACLGEIMARRALAAGWAGVIIFGAVRDSEAIATLDLGVMALRTTAKRPFGTGATGIRDEVLQLGGVEFRPGTMIYADADAVILV